MKQLNFIAALILFVMVVVLAVVFQELVLGEEVDEPYWAHTILKESAIARRPDKQGRYRITLYFCCEKPVNGSLKECYTGVSHGMIHQSIPQYVVEEYSLGLSGITTAWYYANLKATRTCRTPS